MPQINYGDSKPSIQGAQNGDLWIRKRTVFVFDKTSNDFIQVTDSGLTNARIATEFDTAKHAGTIADPFSASAIQSSVNDADSAGGGMALLPAVIFLTSSSPAVDMSNKKVSLFGVSRKYSVIRGSYDLVKILNTGTIPLLANQQIEDIGIDGINNTAGTHGLWLDKVHRQAFSRLNILNMDIGLYMQRSLGDFFADPAVSFCNTGIFLEHLNGDATGITTQKFFGGFSEQNNTRNLYIKGTVGDCSFVDMILEGSLGTEAVLIEDSAGFTPIGDSFIRCYFESSVDAQPQINNVLTGGGVTYPQNMLVDSCTFGGAVNNKPFNLIGDYWNIRNNFFQSAAGKTITIDTTNGVDGICEDSRIGTAGTYTYLRATTYMHRGNRGLNPIGRITPLSTPGASPWTYTNFDGCRERVLLGVTGNTTITSALLNGVANLPVPIVNTSTAMTPILMDPRETLVITYVIGTGSLVLERFGL